MPKIVKSGRKLGKSGKNSKKIKEFTTFPLFSTTFPKKQNNAKFCDIMLLTKENAEKQNNIRR